MRPKIRIQPKIVAVALLCTLFYDSFAVYYARSLEWPTISCSKETDGSKDCLKIFLVADPQVLGVHSESGLLDYIFDWDSNRYLTKTFRWAFGHFKPDAIFYLGDLTYDGRISTDAEFKRNVGALSSIFRTDYPVMNFWLAGDNDVGGENEPIYPKRVKQFDNVFHQKDFAEIKRTIVYKANSLFQTMPKLSPNHDKNFTKIALSHMPLLLSPGRFTETVFTKLRPAVIFSGHKHTAYHLETTLDAMFVSKVVAMNPQDKDNVIKFDIKEENYHEFIVPTCSYRMGVPNVGYGVAVIEKSKHVTYTILWSPRRFEQLFIYLILSLMLSFYILGYLVMRIFSSMCQNSIHYIKV